LTVAERHDRIDDLMNEKGIRTALTDVEKQHVKNLLGSYGLAELGFNDTQIRFIVQKLNE